MAFIAGTRVAITTAAMPYCTMYLALTIWFFLDGSISAKQEHTISDVQQMP